MLIPITYVALLGVAAAFEADGHGLFPTNFSSNVNISDYTVRYAKYDGGRDVEACLENQSYPPDNSTSFCKTVAYSLSEGCNDNTSTCNCTRRVSRNLIVLIYPEQYRFDEGGTILCYFENLLIKKYPSAAGDVIISCGVYTEKFFNNLYVIHANNYAIDGITFSHCGPKSPGTAMDNVTNAIFTNCIFE